MTHFNEVKNIPVVPLRGGAVYPGTTTTISVGRRRSLAAAQHVVDNNGQILILIQYDAKIDDPADDDLAEIGILATVHDLLRTPHLGVQMLVEMHRRVQFERLTQMEPFLMGEYVEVAQHDQPDEELMNEIIAYLEQYAEALGDVNRQVLANTRTKETAGELADYVVGLLNSSLEFQIDVLNDLDGVHRLQLIREYLQQELQVAQIRQQIQKDARDGADKAQREFLLREQMRAIRKELGDSEEDEIVELKDKITEANIPEKIEAKALHELKRLERQGQHSAEASVIRTYLEWMISLPWSALTEDNLEIKHVRAVLDKDHYGLKDVKERIIEYMAVRKLAGNKMRGAIINLNGPPGVGKTSIATSVANAMGRKMVRISLGGVRDESEIRGHRRTYIGAMPGRLIRALRDVEVRNPVIVLDEIDKVGSDWRGDPASALLEVLDPEQNSNFNDHYLEVPFDLSQVMFITTSNSTSTIPAPLLDRMETINMSGYIEDEKIRIAQDYLLPKQKEGHGVADYDIEIAEDAFQKLARHYTHEAGVRQMERAVGSLIRKIAVKIAEGDEGPFTITAENVEAYLGPEKFSYGMAEEADEVGVVTGLAVTGYGGDILSIEVVLSEGKGSLSLTGSLGDVMQESARAALTYARANARNLNLDPAIFDKTDIHIHVPAGAIPKDGPSAGLAITTAIISAFSHRPVRRDVAMTGEVTLRGKALPIGGLKEKAIAAHRAGIKRVILPKDNAKDIPDLPERIRNDLELIPVNHMDDILPLILLDSIAAPLNIPGKPISVRRVPPKSGDKPMRA